MSKGGNLTFVSPTRPRRLLAFAIDLLVVALLAHAADSLVIESLERRNDVEYTRSLFVSGLSGDDDGVARFERDLARLRMVGYPVWLALGMLVYAPTEALWGWTPGKLVTGVRVQRLDGTRPGWSAFLRNVPKALFDPFFHLFGGLMTAADPYVDTWGDLFSLLLMLLPTTFALTTAPLAWDVLRRPEARRSDSRLGLAVAQVR